MEESGGRGGRVSGRGRPQLSCTPCKLKKLKCDRARPCDNCLKRREVDACVYPVTASLARDQTRESKKTKKRIERLESLVMELLERGSLNQEYVSRDTFAINETGDHAQQCQARGVSGNDKEVSLSPSQREIPPVRIVPNLAASSSPSSLWESVLQDIGEIKMYFEGHEEDFEKQHDKVDAKNQFPAEPYMLEGNPSQWDVDTFLHDIPSRPVADILVDHYFAKSSLVRPIVHPKPFLQQYEKFWLDQSNVSKVWIGTLYMIMRNALYLARQSGLDFSSTVGDTESTETLFRMRTKQVLLAEINTKPTIERLVLMTMHTDAEFVQCQDTSTAVWINMATTIRMAMKLGLHREPSSTGEFTVFECEMRRRVWLALVQTDVLISWQVGLPNMIAQGKCDTLLPINLYEDDFDEDSVSLPPPRPWDELTKISPFIVKAPLLAVFTKIASHVLDIRPQDSDIPILERELFAARDSLPSLYKVKPVEETLLDSPSTILRRMSIDQMLHSGLCVLHRRLLPLARSNPEYSHSRKTAIDAALLSLGYQATTHYQSGPAGPWAGYSWLATSVIRHDYLLAAMLICLDLRQGIDGITHPASSDITLWGRDRHEEMVTALKTSYHVWRASKDISIDAFRASEAVAVLLKTIRGSPQSTGLASDTAVSSMPSVETLDVSVDQFVATDFDPFTLSLPFSEMIASPGAIDWVEFDRYVLGGNVDVNFDTI